MSERNLAGKTLGLIAKIEQPRAVHNLPALITQAKHHRHPFGVMIARGEMTDAAMPARAECVMLNKGPAIAEGVSVLDHLIGRMEGHMFKKTPMLRALNSW